MYKKILVAVDQGKLSQKAVDHAITLAQSVGADVVALHVSYPYSIPYPVDGYIYDTMGKDEYEALSIKSAAKILSYPEKKASAAGVKLTCRQVFSEKPWEEIITAAKKSKCNAIVMASHGRRGLSAVLLGSETQKVLTHTNVPVIVVR